MRLPRPSGPLTLNPDGRPALLFGGLFTRCGWKTKLQARIRRRGNDILARLCAEGHGAAHAGEVGRNPSSQTIETLLLLQHLFDLSQDRRLGWPSCPLQILLKRRELVIQGRARISTS